MGRSGQGVGTVLVLLGVREGSVGRGVVLAGKWVKGYCLGSWSLEVRQVWPFSITWGGWDKGVGTVLVRWDVRECSMGVMGKIGGKGRWVLLTAVTGLGILQNRPLWFI
nr:hypothetical protein [Tanacetum cinerariifolium]